jgi:hypothetical protein
MQDEYICDDRNQLDELRKIRAMSDEEFEEYIKAKKAKESID